MIKNRRAMFAVLILAAMLPLVLLGCDFRNSTQDDSLQKTLDSGRLVLGLDASFPPMGFTDSDGQIVGFDIDVAEEVCKRLGVKLVKQPVDWDLKEEDLNNGVIDCIWNGLSETPGRAKTMSLSETYMKNELIFVVRGSSDMKGLRDLPGHTVGVQSGSTAQEVLEASEYYKDITVETFDDNVALLESVAGGRIDTALVDSVVAYYYLPGSSEQLFILPDSLGEEEYTIGFRKGDIALRDRVTQILSEMKADGTLGDISTKWFGSDITTVR